MYCDKCGVIQLKPGGAALQLSFLLTENYCDRRYTGGAFSENGLLIVGKGKDGKWVGLCGA